MTGRLAETIQRLSEPLFQAQHKARAEERYAKQRENYRLYVVRHGTPTKALDPQRSRAQEMKLRRQFLGQPCWACGSTDNLELSHILPVRLGGTYTTDNMEWLCHTCHLAHEETVDRPHGQ